MQRAAPRRRPARPVPEAPVEALAADSERLAKGWLVALIEQRSLAEASGILSRGWETDAPEVCAAAARALGSDQALARLGPPGTEVDAAGSLDALRAVLWSAVRSAWPDAEPDQIWDLGERLALVIGRLSEAATGWPEALEAAVERARGEGRALSLLLAEPVDADRMLAVEDVDDCAAALSRFRAAVGRAAGPDRQVVDGGQTRVWVLAPGAGREQAVLLGEQIAHAVRGATPWRGAPLSASVGVAVLDEDGADADGLIEAAERAMFAAAASGIEIERRPER